MDVFLSRFHFVNSCSSGPGIYHGTLNIETDSEDHIDGTALLPYPPFAGGVAEVPLSTNLTEFHFILLYKDRIFGICNLNDEITYQETLPIVCRTLSTSDQLSDPATET